MTAATLQRYVTWRGLSATLSTLVTLLLGIGAWAWSVHVDQPHRDAVSQSELQMVLQRMGGIEEDVREIRTDVKTLLAK